MQRCREFLKIRRECWCNKQTAGPSIAPLAVRLREASLRMTIWGYPNPLNSVLSAGVEERSLCWWACLIFESRGLVDEAFCGFDGVWVGSAVGRGARGDRRGLAFAGDGGDGDQDVADGGGADDSASGRVG